MWNASSSWLCRSHSSLGSCMVVFNSAALCWCRAQRDVGRLNFLSHCHRPTYQADARNLSVAAVLCT
ncbi:hypothetical protein Mapa_001635 [Marchantia paleacea]|nr:hypothetical protein Mapa_001635 [Marchantia paleacea]